MPTTPLAYCATPGCPQRVPSGHCVQHRRAQRHDASQARHAQGLELQFDRRWRRTSTLWRQWHPLCGERADGQRHDVHSRCTREGRLEPATEVDHIVPHRGDRALRYDPANLQSLCRRCHSAKTLAEGGR